MNLVLSEIKNNIGIITLNSEKTLNSLSLPMIIDLKNILDDWKTNDDVKAVFLQGAGEKALCAGGDVKQMHDAIKEQQAVESKSVPQECYDFFSKEYQVNYDIHTYPKPYIVWGHGIVMGGGIGLMVGGSHRIVTERSKLAMPEITIGLYPDVGGTYFLNKIQSAYGLYLGLTATRLDGGDCLYLGLADYYIKSEQKESVLEALSSIDINANWNVEVTKVLEKLSKENEIPDSQAAAHSEFVNGFESIQSVQEFKQILDKSDSSDEWIAAGKKSFEAGSPSSAHIILEQLKRGKNLSLEEVFCSELNLTCQCCIHPDFAEGVRALLVDKDQSPKWTPETLDEVTSEWIEGYFEWIIGDWKVN